MNVKVSVGVVVFTVVLWIFRCVVKTYVVLWFLWCCVVSFRVGKYSRFMPPYAAAVYNWVLFIWLHNHISAFAVLEVKLLVTILSFCPFTIKKCTYMCSYCGTLIGHYVTYHYQWLSLNYNLLWWPDALKKVLDSTGNFYLTFCAIRFKTIAKLLKVYSVDNKRVPFLLLQCLLSTGDQFS